MLGLIIAFVVGIVLAKLDPGLIDTVVNTVKGWFTKKTP